MEKLKGFFKNITVKSILSFIWLMTGEIFLMTSGFLLMVFVYAFVTSQITGAVCFMLLGGLILNYIGSDIIQECGYQKHKLQAEKYFDERNTKLNMEYNKLYLEEKRLKDYEIDLVQREQAAMTIFNKARENK